MNQKQIDRLLAEEIIPLREAEHEFPPCRGNKVHRSTVTRWITRGVKVNGQVLRLEALRLGSDWGTSKQACRRFLTAMTTNSLD